MEVISNEPQAALSEPKTESNVNFTVAFKKNTYPISFNLDSTLSELRTEIAKATGVAAGLQKLMMKGMLKDDSKTLRELGFKDGVKVMLIGSTIDEVMSAAANITPIAAIEQKAEEEAREALSEKMPHKKIIDKGVPDDVEPGKRGKNENLPPTPLKGVLNNIGTKVRLTFKTFSQELWIQSASNTQKIMFSAIRAVTSEPIKGHEEYHIVSLQLGNSETSKYHLYWVPCQYTRAIRNVLMSDYTGGY